MVGKFSLSDQYKKRYFALRELTSLLWNTNPSYCIFIVFIEVIQGIIPLGFAWITKLIFNILEDTNASNSLNTQNRIILLILIQVGLIAIQKVLQLLSSYFNANLGRELGLSVQKTVFEKINSLEGLKQFEDSNFYTNMQLAAQGAQQGPLQMINILLSSVRGISTLMAFLGTLFALNPILACLIVVSVIPSSYNELSISHQRVNLSKSITLKERLASYYQYILSSAQFGKEIRLLHLGNYFIKCWNLIMQEIKTAQIKQLRRELISQTVMVQIGNLANGVAFAFVSIYALRGLLSIGDVTLYLSAVGSIQGALLTLSSSIASTEENLLFFNYYFELLNFPQPIELRKNPLPIQSLRSGIEIRNLFFRYDSSLPWVLKDLNLFIPKGKCVALVGLNGAGKTTLVKLLTRLYDPIDGKILWDGVDIKNFHPQKYRKQLGVVLQDFAHFDLTTQINIAIGDVDLLEKSDSSLNNKVVQAAIKAGIHTTISKWPNGYQTILSRWLSEDDNGIELSGGEWQKIALSRMFVRKTELLILDEPTAALDAQAEVRLFDRFLNLIKDQTSLIISHRLGTVRLADYIAVLDDGKVIEFGTHDYLIRVGGRYAELFNTQSKNYQ